MPIANNSYNLKRHSEPILEAGQLASAAMPTIALANVAASRDCLLKLPACLSGPVIWHKAPQLLKNGNSFLSRLAISLFIFQKIEDVILSKSLV